MTTKGLWHLAIAITLFTSRAFAQDFTMQTAMDNTADSLSASATNLSKVSNTTFTTNSSNGNNLVLTNVKDDSIPTNYNQKNVMDCGISNCWDNGTLRLRTSLYTHHWSHNPEHNDQQRYIGFDYIRKDNWMVGFGYFRNSFGQPTEYLYFGKEWKLWQPTENFALRGMLTGGLIHGYKGKYKNKIPLNNLGTAPAILPTLALDWKFLTLEMHVLGNAGMMATAGFQFSLDQ